MLRNFQHPPGAEARSFIASVALGLAQRKSRPKSGLNRKSVLVKVRKLRGPQQPAAARPAPAGLRTARLGEAGAITHNDRWSEWCMGF
jgi:hypothetical protein